MNKLLRLIVVTGLITAGSVSALLQSQAEIEPGSESVPHFIPSHLPYALPGDQKIQDAHASLMSILLNIQQQASALNSIEAGKIKTNIDLAIQQATFANAECRPFGLAAVDAIHILLLQYLGLAHDAAGNITNSDLSKQIEAAKQAAWNANQACHAYINSLN